MLKKPKLLHVLPSLDAGGTELGILNLYLGGFYKDFDIEILSLVKGSSPATLQSYRSAFAEQQITILSHKNNIGYQDLPFLFSNFLRQLNRIKPDVLVLSLPKSVIMGTLAAFLNPALVVISFEHMGRRYGYKLAMLMKCITHRINFYFGDCRQTIDTAREIYPPSTPAYEVPLIQIKSTFHAPDAVKPQCYKIMSMGRFTEQKNYIELVHAVYLLKQKNYDIHLTLVGNGPQDRLLKKIVNNLGLTEQVAFPGHITAIERDDMLRATHIYVQPSLYEGQCLSVIEAMAAGKIVVATDVGGMKTYGQHDVNMLKIDGFGRDSIANALIRAIETYPNIGMMRAASQRAEQEYGHDVVQQKWQIAIEAIHKSVNQLSRN